MKRAVCQATAGAVAASGDLVLAMMHRAWAVTPPPSVQAENLTIRVVCLCYRACGGKAALAMRTCAGVVVVLFA